MMNRECGNCKHWVFKKDLGPIGVGVCPRTTKEKYHSLDYHRHTFSDEACSHWRPKH